MSDYSADEIGVTYPSSTGEPTVTIPRVQYDALVAALKPFADAADAAERNLCKHGTDEILIRLRLLWGARAVLRDAGIQTEETKT